jgi:outer membrane protein assembly factor BamB
MKHLFLGLAMMGWCLVCSAQVAEKQPAQAVEKQSEPLYWNQFRGPNGQGVMRTDRVPVKFGPDANILWKAAVDAGQSSPVIWADRLFVTTCSAESEDDLAMVCLDRKLGKVLWHKTAKSRKKIRYMVMNGPAGPSPAADHEHVYAYFGTFGVLCYDHQGKKVWERKLEPPPSQYGMATSPILYKDKVILVMDGNGGASRILAMNRETGATVWERSRPMFLAGWSTPMIWSHAPNDELVVLGSRRLTAYKPTNGEEIWWAGGFSTETIGIPVAGEGMLFVSDAARGGRGEVKWDADLTWKMTLEGFDRNKDGAIQRAEMASGFRIPLRPDLAQDEPGSAYPVPPHQVDGWLTHLDRDKDGVLSKSDWLEFMSGFAMDSKPVLMAVRPGAAGNARPLNVAWEINTRIPEIPSPLYCQGRIYLLRNGGWLTCLEAAKGRFLYHERIGARGQYVASPIVAGDKLITASKRGTVCVIKIGDKLEVLARNKFGEEILATPAVADGRIYLRTASRVYAIGN